MSLTSRLSAVFLSPLSLLRTHQLRHQGVRLASTQGRVEEEQDPLQAIISEYEQTHGKGDSNAKDAAGVFAEIENPSEVDNRRVMARFVNHIMRQGKKSVAEGLVRDSLVEIKRLLPEKDPIEVFVAGLNNVKPLVEVRSLRKSGKNYQVPVPLTSNRQFFLATKWIRTSALKKKGRNFGERLASEILDAYNGQGKAVEKRTELHKAAQANRAFSHEETSCSQVPEQE